MTEEAAPEKAQIVSPKERTAVVPLDWPVEFGGQVYETITIRRVSAREVEEFIEAISTHKDGEPNVKAPMIDCPQEVYEAMDDDDRLRLEEALVPFLPRRLQQAAAYVRAKLLTTPVE